MSVWYLTKGNAWSLLRNKQSQGHERCLCSLPRLSLVLSKMLLMLSKHMRVIPKWEQGLSPAFFPKLANHRPSFKAAWKEISLPDSSQWQYCTFSHQIAKYLEKHELITVGGISILKYIIIIIIYQNSKNNIYTASYPYKYLFNSRAVTTVIFTEGSHIKETRKTDMGSEKVCIKYCF